MISIFVSERNEQGTPTCHNATIFKENAHTDSIPLNKMTGDDMTATPNVTLSFNNSATSQLQVGSENRALVITLLRVFSPLLMAFGVIGNILILVVIRRGAMPSVSTSLSFAYLAIADILVLVFALGDLWLYAYGIEARSAHNAWCKVHVWLTYVSVTLSAWALVFITIQRAISVYMPMRNAVIATKSTTLCGLITMTVLVVGMYLHIFWTIGIEDIAGSNAGGHSATANHTLGLNVSATNESNSELGNTTTTADVNTLKIAVCDALTRHSKFFNGPWTWVDLCIAVGLPTFLLIAGNVVIISQLLMARRRRQEMGQQRDDNKTHSVSVMLVGITLMYIVCSLPAHVLQIGANYWFDFTDQGSRSVYIDALYATCLLMYCNNAGNFALYCLTSKTFRTKFLGLLCKRYSSKSSSMNKSSAVTATTSDNM